ncbi:MAG: hypothetical protein JRI51_00645 [Deltaproteobacteria bacterium]|nr:hypothetical protein [Deltaproteobacteria bacterium]
MDPVIRWLKTIDPILIAPYRWFENPMIGWWLGTFILCLWVVILGDLTILLAFRVNEKYIKTLLQKTDYYHEQSLKAKSLGDDSAYKKINWLANEEFGKSFFMLMAMGMGSLWPAFFAVAWLNERFGQLTFLILPEWAGGYHINFIGPFVALYILARYIFTTSKSCLKTLLFDNTERTRAKR